MPAERQLATSLGVSRPSLREAIQQLNSQGVLISRRGDGTYIQQLPEQWPQQLIVNPISNLIEEDPLYRFDVQEARLVLEGDGMVCRITFDPRRSRQNSSLF